MYIIKAFQTDRTGASILSFLANEEAINQFDLEDVDLVPCRDSGTNKRYVFNYFKYIPNYTCWDTLTKGLTR